MNSPGARDENAKILMQTRVPAALRTYLKRYAKHHALRLEVFLSELLSHFISLRPDLRGLRWRVPHSNRADVAVPENWGQLNLLLAPELAGQLAGLSLATGQSKATILYTSFVWFALYLRPPNVPSGLPPDRDEGTVTP